MLLFLNVLIYIIHQFYRGTNYTFMGTFPVVRLQHDWLHNDMGLGISLISIFSNSFVVLAFQMTSELSYWHIRFISHISVTPLWNMKCDISQRIRILKWIFSNSPYRSCHSPKLYPIIFTLLKMCTYCAYMAPLCVIEYVKFHGKSLNYLLSLLLRKRMAPFVAIL